MDASFASTLPPNVFDKSSVTLISQLNFSTQTSFFPNFYSICNPFHQFPMATKPLTSEAIAMTEKKMDMTLDDIIKMSKPNPGKSRKQRVSNKGHRRIGNGNQDRSFKVRQYMDSRSTLRQGVLAQRRTNFQGNSFPQAAEATRKAAALPFRNRPLNRGKAINWNRQRPGVPLRRQGNQTNGGNALKKQQSHNQQQQQQSQQQQQRPLPRGEPPYNQRPKTLDSLFANMKEQRMKAFTHVSNVGPARGGSFTFRSNGGPARGGGANNQPRQPWLRGRFGSYRH